MTEPFDPGRAVDKTRGRGGFMRTASWATALNGGRQFFTLAVGFVLARMLGPDAYGILAMALVYIAFLEMLQRQGLIGAVIQRPNLDTDHANAAFWLVMAVSSTLTAISMIFAGWWSHLNGTPALRGVIIALSLTLPLQGLNVVQEALLRRQMQFRALTIRTTSAVIVGGIAGVVAALAGWGVWALVTQQIVTASWSTVALWVISGWRPGLHFTRQAVRDLVGFSMGTLLSSLGLFFNQRADVLVSGLLLGPITVGLYRFAARLVDAVISFSAQSAQSMALPELSPFQSEQDEFNRRTKRLARMAGALAIPFLGVMFGAAEVIIATLGPQWSAAAGGLRWLCVYGLIRTLVTLNGPILQAIGRTFVLAAFSWAMAAVSVVVYTVTAVNVSSADEAVQVAAISASRAVVFGAALLLSHLLVMALVAHLRPLVVLAPFALSTVAGVVGAITAGVLSHAVPSGQNPVLVALVSCGVGTAVAYGFLGAIDPVVRQLLAAAWRKLRTATNSVS